MSTGMKTVTFISTGWAGESSERRKSQCVKIGSNQRTKKTSCDKCGVTAGPAVQRNQCCMLTHPDTLLSLCHVVKCNIIIGLLWKMPAQHASSSGLQKSTKGGGEGGLGEKRDKKTCFLLPSPLPFCYFNPNIPLGTIFLLSSIFSLIDMVASATGTKT